jgi:hypothetical protein
MTLEALLLALQARGVVLIADGTALRWRAARGVVTAADKDELAAAKPALLALLSHKRKPDCAPAEPDRRNFGLSVDDVLRVSLMPAWWRRRKTAPPQPATTGQRQRRRWHGAAC